MVSLLNTDEDHYCSDNDYKKDNHSIEKTKKKKYKSYTIEKKNLIIRLSYKYSFVLSVEKLELKGNAFIFGEKIIQS